MVKDQPGRMPMRPNQPLSPLDVRSVVFTTTRMRLGYDVEEVDAFLDQVEWTVEQMLSEIQRLRAQVNETYLQSEAQAYDLRVALEQMLMRIGGPTGRTDPSLIDSNGQLVAPFEGYPPQASRTAGEPGAPRSGMPVSDYGAMGNPVAQNFAPPAASGLTPPGFSPPPGAPVSGPPAPMGPAVDLPPPPGL